MLNKPFALGLIAVGLIITPSTALADVIINNNQQSTIRSRNSPVVNESFNTQRSESTSIQSRTRNSLGATTSRPKFCLPYKTKQQNSTRVTAHNVSYLNNSTSTQSSMARRQVQKTRAALCEKLPK